MPILFDSRDALIRSGPVSTLKDLGVLRDWRGHTAEAILIDAPADLVWSGSDHDATIQNPGPYADIDNGVTYASGSDSLEAANADIVANATDDTLHFASWVKLDELPAVLTETEIPFARATNTSSGAYVELVFVVQPAGTVTLRGRIFTGVTTTTYTHPDNLDIVNWTFIDIHFHWYVGGSSPRIWIDPGNDNIQGGGAVVDIPAGTFDLVEVLRGPGVAPGNLKGVKFADFMVLREEFADVVPPSSITFTTTGAAQNWVVPTGVTSITATMWGGGGGSGGWGEFGGSSGSGGTGGGAGYLKATHVVTPGETLEIWVGGGGGLGRGADHNVNGVSGEGAGGGASSSIRRGVAPGGTLILIAGGGGGGGGGDNSSTTPGGNGGPGGGLIGIVGTNSAFAGGGQGGTQAGGGAGGVRGDGGPPPGGGITGEAGISLQGGRGADGNDTIVSYGGAANPGALNGGAGGQESASPLGYAGAGGGGGGFFGGGGGCSSVQVDAGGGGGGGGSNLIAPTATSPTNGQGVLTTPGGTSDPLYVFPVGYGANAPSFSGDSGFAGANGRVVLEYGGSSQSWRETIRNYTTQAEFDSGVVDDFTPVRFYRGMEPDLGGGQGDRFIHSIAGFLNPAYAPGGLLNRSTGGGPLDTSNSYEYRNTCEGVVDIHYASISSWDITFFTFFRQLTTINNDGDWFARFENDAGEYVQLERDGSDVRMRAFFSDLSTYVQTLNTNPLLNGSWHRLVFKSSSTTSGWLVGINGIDYLPAQPGAVPALSAPMTRFRLGNIDTELALTGWANYGDPEILTTFTSQNTEAAIRSYIQARTDAPPVGPDYYAGYLPQQDPVTGG